MGKDDLALTVAKNHMHMCLSLPLSHIWQSISDSSLQQEQGEWERYYAVHTGLSPRPHLRHYYTCSDNYRFKSRL